MSKRHLALLHAHHETYGAHNVNVNAIHARSFSRNDRIARFVASRVGTMWFCYGLALLMLAWAVLQTLLGKAAWDAFPFPFLFFCLGGIMQSLLMPLLMVAQNLDMRHAELLAESDHLTNQDTAARLAHLEAQLSACLGTQAEIMQAVRDASATRSRRTGKS